MGRVWDRNNRPNHVRSISYRLYQYQQSHLYIQYDNLTSFYSLHSYTIGCICVLVYVSYLIIHVPGYRSRFPFPCHARSHSMIYERSLSLLFLSRSYAQSDTCVRAQIIKHYTGRSFVIPSPHLRIKFVFSVI